MRPHVAAVYAFARLADDIADEGDVDAVAVRHARLDEWIARLHAAVIERDRRVPGRRRSTPAMAAQAPPMFEALAHTIRVVRAADRPASRIS